MFKIFLLYYDFVLCHCFAVMTGLSLVTIRNTTNQRKLVLLLMFW